MRWFAYDSYPSGVMLVSESDIMMFYYEKWAYRMRKVGKDDEINRNNCLEDFCVDMGAWELGKEDK